MKVAVIGAGGWGTALSILLARKGYRVALWARRAEFIEELAREGENRPYLPGVPLPAGVEPVSELTLAMEGASCVVLCPPSQAMGEVCRRLAPHLPSSLRALVSASKGLETSTLLRLSQVITRELPPLFHSRIAVLSGPNFSHEVARGLPAATVVASPDAALASAVQDIFMTDRFRVYTTTDLVGVEMGGALKNVIAIGVGIAEGLGLGHNARAALITRGLAEIRRLGVAVGARAATFTGLSGLGDLVLTCTGLYSRNRKAGQELGSGRSLEEVTRETPMVIEGVPTTQAAYRLSRLLGVSMPITEEIFAVLFEGRPLREAVNRLMTRERTRELEFEQG